jgi:hypothetical protein
MEKSMIKTIPPFINHAIIGIIPSFDIAKFIPKFVKKYSRILDAIKKVNVLKMLIVF